MLKTLKKSFCTVPTKPIYTLYRGQFFSVNLKMDSKLSIEDFCSELFDKHHLYEKHKKERNLEYIINDRYYKRNDPATMLGFLTSEHTPLVVSEDSFNYISQTDRGIHIPPLSMAYQMYLNGISGTSFNDFSEAGLKKSYEEYKQEMERLDKLAIEKTGKTIKEIQKNYRYQLANRDKTSLFQSKAYYEARREQRLIRKIVSQVESTLPNQTVPKWNNKKNLFNLPVDKLNNLLAKGDVRTDPALLTEVMDMILSAFVIALEKEIPMAIELDQEIKPSGFKPKKVPIALNHKATKKVFPFTFAAVPTPKPENMRDLFWDRGLDSLHTLKKVSRCRYNMLNSFHVGCSTNLTHWTFNAFQRPENLMDMETEEHLNISKMYIVNYDERRKVLDWAQLNEVLNFFKCLIKITEDEWKVNKNEIDERFRESANWKRRVLL